MQKSMNRCIGCGAAIQSHDKEAVGYAKSSDQVFCQNCFRLMHYGKAEGHFHPDELPTFKKDSLIVVVSSVLYLDTLLTSPVKRLNDDYKVIYLINQIDLLPDATSKSILLGNIKKRFKEFRVAYDEIILMSAINPYDIEELKSYILNKRYEDVYLIGLQNSGKTTIFKSLTGNKDAIVLPKAALTQTILSGKLENVNIYDTPGLYQSGYLHEFLPYDVYKEILPTKQFKPRNGILETDDAILIGGILGLSVIKGTVKSVLYVKDNVKHQLSKADKALSILEKNQVFDVVFEKYGYKDYVLKDDKKYQITMADFGILQVTGPATVRVIAHPKLHVSLTEGFFR